jgi:hypothetical protein
MKKTLCISVKVESLIPISDKAYKVRSFDGSEDILPKSCVFGQDYEVQKSEAYWVASWILGKKNILYSNKKQRWFDESGKMLPTVTYERHTPTKEKPVNDNTISDLKRC